MTTAVNDFNGQINMPRCPLLSIPLYDISDAKLSSVRGPIGSNIMDLGLKAWMRGITWCTRHRGNKEARFVEQLEKGGISRVGDLFRLWREVEGNLARFKPRLEALLDPGTDTPTDPIYKMHELDYLYVHMALEAEGALLAEAAPPVLRAQQIDGEASAVVELVVGTDARPSAVHQKTRRAKRTAGTKVQATASATRVQTRAARAAQAEAEAAKEEEEKQWTRKRKREDAKCKREDAKREKANPNFRSYEVETDLPMSKKPYEELEAATVSSKKNRIEYIDEATKRDIKYGTGNVTARVQRRRRQRKGP